MPLFLIYWVFCTWYRNRRNTLLLHWCCRLEATGSRVEAGLQGERYGYTWVLRSKSVEELPSVPTGIRTYAPISIWFGFGLAWNMLRILFACTRTMFNDKLLEYRENGDLERLSRQVAVSKLGLQKYFRTLHKLRSRESQRTSWQIIVVLWEFPNSSVLFGLSIISCLW